MDETTWAFFLSHAHEDRNKDGILRRFFSELNSAVARHLGLEGSQTGFLDTTGIPVGKDWSAQLGGALRNSKVAVCLMSEAFFESSNCGRELDVFLRRRQILANDGSNPTVILPLWWDKARVKIDPPNMLGRFQWNDDLLPESYRKKGIRALLLGGDTAGCEALIHALTLKIAEARDEDLPPIAAGDLPEFSDLPNALVPSHAAVPPPPPPVGPAGEVVQMPAADDPYEVNFVYVGPNLQQLPEQRKNRDGYNVRGAWYWEAYRPQTRDRIGQIINQVSVKYRIHDFESDHAQIVEYLETATFEKDQLAILVVDPWATLQPGCRDLLSKLDRSKVVNYAVISVWNEDDNDVTASRDLLEANLRVAFPRSYSADRLLFCRNTGTRDQFVESLRSLLENLTNMAMARRSSKVLIAGPPLTTFNMLPRHVA